MKKEMREGKRFLGIISCLSVAMVIVAVCFASFFAKSGKMVSNSEQLKNAENQMALSYGTADASTNSDYVQFSAFFTRDVNGNAEKLAGTCKNVSEKDTLFLDINVLSDGYLEDGAVITVEGANFTYKVNAPADEVLKTGVISDNATSFTLNKMQAGTQKLMQGEISANLGNNVDNYSRETTVKLVATHVSNEGVRTPIIVEKKVIVDWYGDLGTEIFVYKNYSKDGNADDDSIYYYYKDFKKGIDSENNTETPAKNSIVTVSFSMDEIKKELLLKENSIDVIIPNLNGKAPEKVKCINSDVSIEKVEDTENGQKYRLTKIATVGNDNVITKKLADENTYTLTVKYPEEAYESINEETTLGIKVQGYYIAFNNSNEELNLYKDAQIAANESKSNVAEKTIKVVFKKYEETHEGSIDFDVAILNKKYSEMKNCFVISKETLAKWFDDEESTEKFEYKVEWDAIVKGENQNSVIKMSECQGEILVGEGNQATEYGDTFNKNYLEKYIINNGLYFENVEEVLGAEGSISIFNNDTNELIKTVNVEEAKTYTAENPLIFEDVIKQNLKHIRIETSTVVNTETKVLKVVILKEINKDLFKTDYTKEDVEDIEVLNTVLEGTLQSLSVSDESNSVITVRAYDSVHLYNKTSYAEIEVETKQISTVKMLEHEKLFIKTLRINDEFDSDWKNGRFVVEIPKEIAGIAINSITADNGVTVDDWELSEIDGRNVLKIKTVNDEPTLFTITVDCDVTPDYKINSTTKQFKLYYYNELANRYYNLGEDKYDVNGNTVVEENVGYAEGDAEFVSAQELITFEKISNYKQQKQTTENGDGTTTTQNVWSNDTTIAPYIADINNEERQATINIILDNKYKSTIENVKILGKIPFEGNSYILNGESLNTQFTTQMKSNEVQGKKELIRVPAELKDKVVIYYSNKENATKDLNDEENNWKLINELVDTDVSSIKSFLIDFQNEKVEFEKEFVFSYDVKIPDEVQNGRYGYSNHTVYYQVSTTDGKIDMATEPTKVGIRPMVQYDLEIKTFEKDTDKEIKPASYRLVWNEIDESGNTLQKNMDLVADENGKIEQNLLLDTTYELQQIFINEDYFLNDAIYTFSLNNKGELTINDNSIYSGYNDNILNLEIQNIKIKKYNLKINKVDENGNELDGAEFLLTSSDNLVFEHRNDNFNGLYEYISEKDDITAVYTLKEIKAPTGYILNNTEIQFKAYEDNEKKLKFEVLTPQEDLIRINEETHEKEIRIDGDTVTVNIENKRGNNILITKIDEETGKTLQGAEFKVEKTTNDNIIELLNEENLKTNSTYKFIKNGNVFESNNTGIANSTATSYMEIDLRDTEPEEKCELTLNVKISSELNNDVGYAIISSEYLSSVSRYTTNGRFVYLSGNVDNSDYSIELDGGKVYYLYFGYSKNYTSNIGNDKFIINSVTIKRPFKEYCDVITDDTGKVAIEIPDSDKIKITETVAPVGYKLEKNVKIIDLDDVNMNITISNKKVSTTSNFTINKTNESGEKIPDAVFEVYKVNEKKEIIDFAKDISGRYIGTNENDKYRVTTNSNAKIDLLLPEGYYKAVEVKAPDGYILEDDENLRTIYFEIKDEHTYSSNIPEKTYNEGSIINISSEEQFNEIARKVNSGEDNYEGKTLKLLNDLDFNNKELVTIGTITNSNSVFKGNVDGNNHKIKNATTDSEAGLFIRIEDSYIKDLTFENCNFNGSYSYGGAIREAYNSTIDNVNIIGDTSINNTAVQSCGTVVGYIENTTVKNCINERNFVEDYGGQYVGGIVGKAKSSNIINCKNKGNIYASKSGAYIGGIAGVMETEGWIEGCENTGNILSSSGDYAAGIVSGTSTNITIIDCINNGEISTNSGSNGIAYIVNEGKIIKCENTGIITSNSNSNGVVHILNDGKIEKSSNSGAIMGKGSPASGLAYQINYSEIRDCNNSGHVEAPSCSSGILYEMRMSKVIDCFNTGEITYKEGSSINSAGLVYNELNDSIVMNCYNAGKIVAKSCAGGVVYSATDSSIINCHNNEEITAGVPVGGIAYSIYNSKVDNCYNVAELTSTSAPAAGVVWSASNNSIITNSYNTGNVNSTSTMGGIVDMLASSKIYNCYNTGNITSTGAPVGGIARLASGNSIIANCYNSGILTTTCIDTNTSKNMVGGIIEEIRDETTLLNCYYTGDSAIEGVFDKADEEGKYEKINLSQLQSENFTRKLNKNKLKLESSGNLYNWKYNEGLNPTMIANTFTTENNKTVVNEKSKYLTIIKTDEETGEPLAGAEFRIEAPIGESIEELATDENMKQGSYEYKFEKSGNGYKANNQWLKESAVASYIKIDLSDFTDVCEVMVNADVYINTQYTQDGMSKYGKGYVYATVTEDNKTPEYSYSNGKFIDMSAYNTNIEGGEYKTTLKGGKVYYLHFVSYNDNHSIVNYTINSVKLDKSYTYNLYNKITTDSNGKATVEIPAANSLKVMETRAPEGYILDNYSEIVEVTGDDINLNITNKKQQKEPSFTIYKTDESGNPIPNTKFAIYSVTEKKEIIDFAKDKSGNYAGKKENNMYIFTTNEEGKITVALPGGYYKAVEIKAASGYYLDNDENARTTYFEVEEDTEIPSMSYTIQDKQFVQGELVEVRTASELIEIANKVNSGEDNYAGKTIKLMNDLDFDGVDNIITIGKTNIFRGNFDGNNHTIRNINSDEMSGLFGRIVNSYIKDLKIENANFNMGATYGGLIAEAYNSKIYNVKIIGDETINVKDMENYGIIAGYLEDTIIENCSNERNLVSEHGVFGKSGGYFGGLVGMAKNSSFLKCSNKGSLKVQGSSHYVGGIVGFIEKQGIIDDCNNEGDISGDYGSAHVAGIIYETSDNTIIKNCYNLGNLKGNFEVCGIAYKLNNSDIYNCYNKGELYSNTLIAGIVWKINNGNIIRCYNEGNQNGNGTFASGIAGEVNNGKVIECYNLGDITIIYNRGSGLVDTINSGLIEKSYNKGLVSGQEASGIAHTLNNTKVKKCYNEGTVKGNGSYTAGIAYEMYYSKILDCYNNGNLSCTSQVSGIVGCSKNNSIILNCYNDANVENFMAFGIVYNAVDTYISNCYNNKDIGNNSSAPCSGIAYSIVRTVIDNCYNKGKISSSYIGGIVYYAYENSYIVNCYNEGEIESTDKAAGIVFGLNSSTICNCYNNGKVSSGMKDVAGIAYSADSFSVVENNYSCGQLNSALVNAAGEMVVSGIHASTQGNIPKNCYYSEEIADYGIYQNEDVLGQVESVSDHEIKSENFVEKLNNNRIAATSELNVPLSSWKYNENSTPLLINNTFRKVTSEDSTYQLTNKKIDNKLIIKKVDKDTKKGLRNTQFQIKQELNLEDVMNDGDGEYHFIKNGNTYESSNMGIDNSICYSFIPIDLRGIDGRCEIVVNAKSSCSLDDHCLASISQIQYRSYQEALNTSLISIWRSTDSEDYRTTLDGGKLYYLQFWYKKSAVGNYGDDKFTINSVSVNLSANTNIDGEISTNVFTRGKIFIKEVNTPNYYEYTTTAGPIYSIIDDEIVINKEDVAVEVTCADAKIKPYTINKKDEETNKPIQGAKFVIYKIDNPSQEYDFAKYADGSYVGQEEGELFVNTTDYEGKILMYLPNGVYKAVEVEAAKGYEINENNEFIFVIDNDTGGYTVTPDNCYQVNYIEDLLDLYKLVKEGDTFEGKTVKLMRDLDYEDDSSYKNPNTEMNVYTGDQNTTSIKSYLTTNGTSLVPIGNSTTPFKGTFDGNNKTIKNLHTGVLFEEINNATIKNITFRDTKSSAGRIITNANNSKIENMDIVGLNASAGSYGVIVNNVKNCDIKNIQIKDITCATPFGLLNNVSDSRISNIKISGTGNITIHQKGLIIGTASNTIISNCGNDSTITNSTVGGIIVGDLKDSIILDCYNNGNITNLQGNSAGIIYNAQNSKVIRCYNTGEINVNHNSNRSVGGIVFEASNNTLIQDCYNSGDIYGYEVGGIVCKATDSIISNCHNANKDINSTSPSGGIANTIMRTKINNCYNSSNITSGAPVAGITYLAKDNSIITNCYNTGKINSSSNAGGVVYNLSEGKVYNCYNTGNVTSQSPAGGVVNNGSGMISNCYNSGIVDTSAINSSTSKKVMGGIAYSARNLINCYYLESSALEGIYDKDDVPGQYEKITQLEFESQEFVDMLNNNKSNIDTEYKLNEWILDGTPKLKVATTPKITKDSATITNQKLPERQLTIIKIDKDTQEQLAGAEIKLEKVEGAEGAETYTEVGTYTSSSTEVITENIYATYKYRITETKAPKGYAISSESVIINPGTEDVEITLENEKIPTFNVTVHHYLEVDEGEEQQKLQEDETDTLNNGDYYVIFSKDKNSTDYQDEYFEIKPSDELLKKYELVSTVTKNEAEGESLEDIEVTYYYQIKEHKITTKVEIPEGRTEKGGAISGDITVEGNDEYETVDHEANSTKDIIITPDTGYRVKEIRVVSTDINENKTEVIVYGDDSDSTSEVKARLHQDGTVTMTKFSDVTADKEIIVVFEPNEGAVIVHHYIENTTEKLSKDEVTKDIIGTVVETNPVNKERYVLISGPEGEDRTPTIDSSLQQRIYYYQLEHQITTDVIEHNELYVDKDSEGNITERNVQNIKGGAISGEDEEPYEAVIRYRDNTKKIEVTPSSGYEIVSVTINDEVFDYKNSSDTNDKVTFDENGKLTLDEAFFTSMDEDKHIEVSFKKKSKVIVKYLEEETGKVLYKTPDNKDFIEILGLEGDDFNTEHKIIPGYKDSTLGITDEDGNNISDYSRVQIESNSAKGNMYANEITIIYWYKRIESKAIERHIEINEKGEATELANREFDGYALDIERTRRMNFGEKYIAVDGPENSNPAVTVVGKNVNSKDVVLAEEGVNEVWYYYEKQFNVTTEVKPHIEKDVDGNDVKVDGGTISKEYKKDENDEFVLDSNGNKIEVTYENILNRGDSTKEIVIKPDEGYRIKSITINDVSINLDSFTKAEDGSITLPEKYFEDVKEDKHVVVEFEKIPAKVIVKYLDISTGEEVLDDKVVEGYVKDHYDEQRVEVDGYISADPEPDNNVGEMTEDTITVIYYYTKQFIITTDVKEHEEFEGKNIVDVIVEKADELFDEAKDNLGGTEEGSNTDEGHESSDSENRPKVQVKGGTITGELTPENDAPVEIVERGKDNTKVIVMKPDEKYRVKSITIYEGEKDENGEFTGKYYEIDIDELKKEDGTVEIPEKYFEDMQSNKHIVVEYEKIPAKVIVNYKEKSTEQDVAKQLTGEGFVGDEYITHEQEIPYYELLKDELPENAEGVLVENETVVNYWYRRLLFNMKLVKEFTSIRVNGNEILGDDNHFARLDIKNSDLKNINIVIKYKVAVTNTEEVEGKARIIEQIPVGFKFVNSESDGWVNCQNGGLDVDNKVENEGKSADSLGEVSDNNSTNRFEMITKELQPGETAEYEVILEWDANKKCIGNFENIARIMDTENVPEFEETTLEDNQDSCMFVISIKTGKDRSVSKIVSIACFVLAGICTVAYVGNEIYYRKKYKN